MVKVGSRWRSNANGTVLEILKVEETKVLCKDWHGIVFAFTIDRLLEVCEPIDAIGEPPPITEPFEVFKWITSGLVDPPLSDEAKARYAGFVRVAPDGDEHVDVAAWRRAVE